MKANKGELRRIMLLEAAEQVLVTSGNATATMRNFAAAAHVSIGHLQYYFPARSDLLQAVLQRVLHRSLAWMRETTGIDLDAGSNGPVSRDDSHRLVVAIMQQQTDPTVVRLYVEIWAMAASDEEIAAVLREFYSEYVRYVERVIERARPGLARGARRARAHSVVTIFEGVVIMSAGFAGQRPTGTDMVLLGAIQDVIHRP
ncbi:TetR/AcrR family transcriptional regulator [Cryobacterium sp. TMT4-31]|uniref:TetR/AcrR family transcriptional regulator n=1 Tax=Cryobacterium sp. TMT4-31 TaxID=1259259 RepID=UPI00106D6156|nr:TetR/AcrR family transcriptional regulator [Cryobacterium sp. TMT4-31]TFC86353.1 TetR/AcrR family transcriptional regulator [Cryobacterium sp. TMT4-31]